MSRTEALRVALAEVWSGAQRIDAEAVMDHLADNGFEVVQMPAARKASKQRRIIPPAVTSRLPKRRSA